MIARARHHSNVPFQRTLTRLRHHGSVRLRLSNDERSELALLAFVLGALGAVLSLTALIWAHARTYHDNQRNWALVLGWTGVFGSVVMAVTALLLTVGRRLPSRDDPSEGA